MHMVFSMTLFLHSYSNMKLSNMKLNKSNMKLNKQRQMPPLSFRHKYKNVWLKMGDEKNWENAQQTLLGMEIGRNLHFDVISIC